MLSGINHEITVDVVGKRPDPRSGGTRIKVRYKGVDGETSPILGPIEPFVSPDGKQAKISLYAVAPDMDAKFIGSPQEFEPQKARKDDWALAPKIGNEKSHHEPERVAEAKRSIAQEKYSDAAKALKDYAPTYLAAILKDIEKGKQLRLLRELIEIVGNERVETTAGLLGIKMEEIAPAQTKEQPEAETKISPPIVKEAPAEKAQINPSPAGPKGSQEPEVKKIKLGNRQIESLGRIKTQIDQQVAASNGVISDFIALPWSKELIENFTSTEAAVVLSVLRGKIKNPDTIIATIINGFRSLHRYFAQETEKKYYELVGRARPNIRPEQALTVPAPSVEREHLPHEIRETLEFIIPILKTNLAPKELLDEFESPSQPLRDAIEYTIHHLIGERTRMKLYPTVIENTKIMMRVFKETGNIENAIAAFCDEANWN